MTTTTDIPRCKRGHEKKYYPNTDRWRCRECEKARQSTPEWKSRRKEYRNREDVKANKQNYSQGYYLTNREQVCARQRAYNQTPDRKARRKVYNQTPERKAAQRARASTPEAKAKRKEYRDQNRDAIRAHRQEYRAQNRDAIRAQKREYYARPEVRAALYARNIRRKKLIKGAECEVFQREEVFIRDDWLCGLCGEPTDPTVEYPHPHSPSLDHLLPVTRGGSHTRENAICAHLGCNIQKNNRTFEEWCEYRGVRIVSRFHVMSSVSNFIG
ncbi:hypothetical protein GII30_20515 [Gordonia amarae]|uniref:HNH nuclease domain-containing protein n=2 Tax=Gordonia amarae TaxID=36821 RepID=G7GSW5_9ACTN|nr:Rieske Fe-S protein [Gordonia amarae]QHN32483.1 hypothetical protein GII32_20680 [Gordonia amarae]QHN41231.1 hypothetical protein GII30_20515 [Gordonia amarae]GAB06690.1 hypothetical protein GOAMR_58_00660 [Gordonia amarae NBRC 15530]